MSAASGFAQTYREAREKFLAAARARALAVTSHAHPLRGRDGETLAMDIARDGPADAKSVLVLSSACHGVEGFCGSGAQVALLGNEVLHAQAQAAGVALLYVHGLNPHGFSFWRRTTHENVDLNRNFHDFSKPLPRNTAYDEIAHLVVPAVWPPDAATQQGITDYVARHGPKGLQAAVTAGQYDHPDGLFFGGREPTWSHRTIRQVLGEHARRCQRLGWIDFHTGLGPSGHGERIFACRDDAPALARARVWWGRDVTSIYDGSSTSALLTGMMWMAAYEECPQAEYTGIALEYGTVPTTEVIDALRADQWLQLHPGVETALRSEIKRRVRDAFYTDTDAWKEAIVRQALDAAQQAVSGLAGSPSAR